MADVLDVLIVGGGSAAHGRCRALLLEKFSSGGQVLNCEHITNFLLAAGVALVQLDEPVLTEVVFTGARNTRRFMCGALSEKGDAGDRARVRADPPRGGRGGPAAGAPRAPRLPRQLAARRRGRAGGRLPASPAPARARGRRHALARALHGARGRDRGLEGAPVHHASRGRGGEPEARARGERGRDRDASATRHRLLGAEHVLLTPDCGFATFADHPLASAPVAEAKLLAISRTAAVLRRG